MEKNKTGAGKEMMLTEEEAKKNWCPMVRFSTGADDNNASNRWKGNLVPPECACLASGCMLWRWEKDLCAQGYRPDSDKGYCRLGSKP